MSNNFASQQFFHVIVLDIHNGYRIANFFPYESIHFLLLLQLETSVTFLIIATDRGSRRKNAKMIFPKAA